MTPRLLLLSTFFLLLSTWTRWQSLPVCEWLVRAVQRATAPWAATCLHTMGHTGTPWDTRTDLSAHDGTQWWDTRTAQHRTQWSPVGGHEAPRVLSVLWRVGQTEARSYLPIEHLHLISTVPLARGLRSKAITAQAPLAEIATDDAD